MDCYLQHTLCPPGHAFKSLAGAPNSLFRVVRVLDGSAPVTLPDTPEEAGDTESGDQQDEKTKHRGVPQKLKCEKLSSIER